MNPTPSTIRDLLADANVVRSARGVRKNDTPVMRAALRGAIKLAMPHRVDLDDLMRAVLSNMDAYERRASKSGHVP